MEGRVGGFTRIFFHVRGPKEPHRGVCPACVFVDAAK